MTRTHFQFHTGTFTLNIHACVPKKIHLWEREGLAHAGLLE